jgi:phospholipid-binding lipoprotein MlaA
VKKLLAAAVIMFFFSIVCFCAPTFAADHEPGVYLAQQSQKAAAKEAEEDEDYEDEDEDEDEYAEDVVQINDPLYRLNQDIYAFNDSLYIILLKPTAKVYNKIIPVEIRTCVKNFFYNLRFPIRFVNCLLQAKGFKAAEEFASFLLNTGPGFLGIADVASYYDNLPPSPEDLGQTLAVWGADNGFYIMFPILGPSSLRDSARFVDSMFLDPISWLDLDWKTKYGILAYDKFNEISFQIDDIDALKKAVFDPYVAVRNAYVQHRNKLIDE